MELGPFDLSGGPFLVLYLVVLACAWLAGPVLAAWLRSPGRPGRINGEDDLAALAGGPLRLAEAATARLLANGKLVQQGRSQFHAVDLSGGETPVERAILHMARPSGWKNIVMAATAEFSAIERRLAASGLMLDRGQHGRLRSIAAAPLLLALGFGLTKLVIGLGRDKPVGLLIALLVVTGLLAIWQYRRTSGATQAGLALLQDERGRSDRLRRAPTGGETGLAVALFGTVVLSGSELTAFHEMRHRAGSGSSSTDSGCGGDSSGGGDGGCGGCGGCGG